MPLCEVLNHEQVTRDIYRLVLHAPEIAGTCRPGQFVHLRVCEGCDPLLRRPLSIHRSDPERQTITLLCRTVGRGTALLQNAQKEDILDVMGPLGHGFYFEDSFSHAVVVAGGMGSAPVFFLVETLIRRRKKVDFFWGVKTRNEFYQLNELEKYGVDCRLSTVDGSLGHTGMITDLLGDFLSSEKSRESFHGFLCGPVPLLKAVQAMTLSFPHPWQVSVEKRMACGGGVCMGCAVKMRKGGVAMACTDGPVFDLQEIVIDD